MKIKLYQFVIIAVTFLVGCNSKNGLGFNENASIDLLGELPENPLLLHTITTSFHSKDSLMTILYGNQLAYNYAKTYGNDYYPIGAVLYSITWQIQEDEQWFGGNVPKNIRTIERLEFLEKNKPKYSSFNSYGIKHIHTDTMQKRINHIKEMKMAVSP